MAPSSAAIVGLARPPPGVTPNFAHPESRGYRISITLTVCLVLCTGVVLLRLYTRYFITRMIGADDYMIIAAMLLSVGYVVSVFELNKYGVGMHMWDIPLTNSPLILKWSLTQGVFFGLSILFAKLSILQFYLRLSPHPYFRITVHTLSVTITLYSLVVAFQFLYACQPIAKYWDYTIKYGTCINSVTIWIFNSVMNSITDIAMIFLPILMMWNVQIARRQKIAVNCIFMLGGFVAIVSIIRLYYIVQYLYVKYDSTWSAVAAAVWAVIELYVAIICACLPHTKPFFMRHFPKLLRSSTSPPFSTAHPYSNTQRYSNSQAFSRGIRSEANDEDTIDTRKDISLRVLVTGGKTATASIADTESQKAILGDDGIFVRSELHVGEESTRRDIP